MCVCVCVYFNTCCKPESPAGASNFSLRDEDFTRLSVDAREPDSDAKLRRQATLLADSFTGHLPSITVCRCTTAPAADATDEENCVNRTAYISDRCLRSDSQTPVQQKCTLITEVTV